MLLMNQIENISLSSRLVRIGLGLALLAPVFLPQFWDPKIYGLLVLSSALPILSGFAGYCPFAHVLSLLAQKSAMQAETIISLLLVAGSAILLASLFIAKQNWLFSGHDALARLYPIVLAIYAVEIIGTVSSKIMQAVEQKTRSPLVSSELAQSTDPVKLPDAA